MTKNHMWSHYRDIHGVVPSIEHYYPHIISENKDVEYKLRLIRQLTQEVDKFMRELPDDFIDNFEEDYFDVN